jgi:hypothetical protein
VPYFTTDELRALPDMDNTSRFSDDRLEAAHDWIVGIIERECDTAFVPTTVTGRRLSGGGLDSIRLPDNYVTAVTAVTVDGVAYDAPTLAGLYLEDGYLYQPSGSTWSTTSLGNVTVTYTHSYSTTPPPDLKEAALRAARNWLLTTDAWSGTDSRATSISNDFGNIQISVAGPDRPTGIPDVDTTIMAWARRVRVPKVR